MGWAAVGVDGGGGGGYEGVGGWQWRGCGGGGSRNWRGRVGRGARGGTVGAGGESARLAENRKKPAEGRGAGPDRPPASRPPTSSSPSGRRWGRWVPSRSDGGTALPLPGVGAGARPLRPDALGTGSASSGSMSGRRGARGEAGPRSLRASTAPPSRAAPSPGGRGRGEGDPLADVAFHLEDGWAGDVLPCRQTSVGCGSRRPPPEQVPVCGWCPFSKFPTHGGG